MATINSNQFKQGPILGQIDLSSSGISSAKTYRTYAESSTLIFSPGTGVKLVDGATGDVNGVPVVDEIAASTEESTGGIIMWTPKKGEFDPGDTVQCAQDGDVIRLLSSAAIARGVFVSLDSANQGKILPLSTNAQIGITIDRATAADQLIRVKIKTKEA